MTTAFSPFLLFIDFNFMDFTALEIVGYSLASL